MAVIEHGPSIGTYRERDIPSYIITKDGQRYEYDRIALETKGGVALDQLARGECVIAPGLIYRPTNVVTLPVVRIER